MKMKYTWNMHKSIYRGQDYRLQITHIVKLIEYVYKWARLCISNRNWTHLIDFLRGVRRNSFQYSWFLIQVYSIHRRVINMLAKFCKHIGYLIEVFSLNFTHLKIKKKLLARQRTHCLFKITSFQWWNWYFV